MRLALIEYLSAGGDAGNDPAENAALRAQGMAMLQAVARDLSDSFTLCIPVCDSHAAPLAEAKLAAQLVPIPAGDAPARERRWFDMATECDAALLIAPETGGTLVRLMETFQNAGIELLNCDAEFAACAADKLLTSRRLAQNDVPTPETLTAGQFHDNGSSAGWLRKPRLGCGSEGIAAAKSGTGSTDDVFQPFVLGAPVGCAVLVSRDGRFTPLSPLVQRLRPGTFEYDGSGGAVPEELDEATRQLAVEAVRALPGRPLGYLGVDMILAQVGQAVVLDVNPRFTCSVTHLPPHDRQRIAATYREIARAAAFCHPFGVKR